MARGRGEGSVYLAKSGLWTAAVALPPDPLTGRRRRKVVRAKTKAEVVRRMRAVQLELAAAGDLPAGRAPTLAQWLTRWIDQDVAPTRKPATTADYRSVVRTHIVPAIGSRRLDRLTAADVRAVHAERQVRPATVERGQREAGGRACAGGAGLRVQQLHLLLPPARRRQLHAHQDHRLRRVRDREQHACAG